MERPILWLSTVSPRSRKGCGRLLTAVLFSLHHCCRRSCWDGCTLRRNCKAVDAALPVGSHTLAYYSGETYSLDSYSESKIKKIKERLWRSIYSLQPSSSLLSPQSLRWLHLRKLSTQRCPLAQRNCVMGQEVPWLGPQFSSSLLFRQS